MYQVRDKLSWILYFFVGLSMEEGDIHTLNDWRYFWCFSYRMIQQSFIDMENMFELFNEEQEVSNVSD